jgi:shikimate kinase
MTDETVLPRPAGGHHPATNLVLVGFMGAGKTTVGQAVAERLGWRFADLDRLIEAREGRTVPQIFAEDGEERFRYLECKTLEEVVAAPDSQFLVLALGGGAFVSKAVRELLAAHDIPIVWLDAPAEELFRRCEQPEVVRPLRRGFQEFSELYEQRLSSYRQAYLHVVTNAKEISAVADEIIEELALVPGSRSSG